LTAVVVDSTNAAAWLRYKIVEDDLTTTNLTIPRGSITFWLAPNWSSAGPPGGTGPGQYGRLFEVGSYTTNASFGWMSLYLDPAGTNLFFSSQTNGAGATYLSAPISFTNGVWNSVALTWCATNSALYLNGSLLTNGPGIAYLPGPNALTNGFSLGSDGATGLYQSRSMLHDLYIYSRPLTSDEVFSDFLLYSLFMAPLADPTITPGPSTPTTDPVFKAITGLGYLTPLSNAVLVICAGDSDYGTAVQTCDYESKFSVYGYEAVTFHKIAIPIRAYELRTGRLVANTKVQISGSSCPSTLEYTTYLSFDSGPPSEVYVTPHASNVRAAFDSLINP